MNDGRQNGDVERYLGRFAPANPPPGLRQAAVDAGRAAWAESRRTWMEWAVPLLKCAALLAVLLAVGIAASVADRRMTRNLLAGAGASGRATAEPAGSPDAGGDEVIRALRQELGLRGSLAGIGAGLRAPEREAPHGMPARVQLLRELNEEGGAT